MSDISTVNGIDVSFGSMIFKIGGERFFGQTSVSYGHKLETAKGYSMKRSQAPDRRSRGKYTVEPLKVKFYKSTAQAIRRKLAALSSNGVSYGEPEFSATLQYVEQSSQQSHMVEFFRLRYVGETESDEEGPDLLMEEIEFDPMLIKKDGLLLAAANPAEDA